jgi:hypothetical protein
MLFCKERALMNALEFLPGTGEPASSFAKELDALCNDLGAMESAVKKQAGSGEKIAKAGRLLECAAKKRLFLNLFNVPIYGLLRMRLGASGLS